MTANNRDEKPDIQATSSTANVISELYPAVLRLISEAAAKFTVGADDFDGTLCILVGFVCCFWFLFSVGGDDVSKQNRKLPHDDNAAGYEKTMTNQNHPTQQLLWLWRRSVGGL